MPQLARAARLRAAAGPSVERTDFEEAWHRHGPALFALALVLFEDVDEAESVVVRAFLDACTPADIAVASVTRRELARYVYVLWQRRTAAPARVPSAGWRPAGLAEMGTLSPLQRTAIALGLFGEHTYVEIALLMDLPAPEIAALMRSGLLKAGGYAA